MIYPEKLTVEIPYDPGSIDDVARDRLRREADALASRTAEQLGRIIARLQKEAAARGKLRDRLESSEFWETAAGKRMAISEMTPNHAHNAYLYLLTRAEAIYAEMGHGARGDLDADTYCAASTWIDAQPVMRALDARAKAKETLVHKVRDKRSRKKWEKAMEGKRHKERRSWLGDDLRNVPLQDEEEDW